MTAHDSAAKGVADAFAEWIGDHPVSVQEIVNDATKATFAEWLEARGSELLPPAPPKLDPDRLREVLAALDSYGSAMARGLDQIQERLNILIAEQAEEARKVRGA
ncbi:hypothetical protein [Nonomuraea sp. NPDC002799]